MIVGYTGSREGMTAKQKQAVRLYLFNADEGHHGDCIGGDAEFHEICIELDIPVVIHPPTDPKLRAWCEGALRVEEELPYLERNMAIVKACEVFLGTPKERIEPEPARGQGTWSAIRHARRVGRKHYVIYPDGSMTTRHAPISGGSTSGVGWPD